MTRIRTLTAAGVLAGATVLGGAGLAGATDSDTQVEEPQTTEADLVSKATDDPSTGEAETLETEAPAPPALPEQADGQAQVAIAAAPAFAADEAPSDSTDQESDAVEETEDPVTDDAEDGAPPADTHGAAVSEVAQSDDPGPGPDHGPAVAEAAQDNQGRAASRSQR